MSLGFVFRRFSVRHSPTVSEIWNLMRQLKIFDFRNAAELEVNQEVSSSIVEVATSSLEILAQII